MSTTPEQARPASNAFKRYFFVLLIGLVLGAIATVMLTRTLDSRKTWKDRWPHATMHAMNAHMSQLEEKAKQNRCAATDILPDLQVLRALTNDLEPAFPGLADDERFGKHASDMRSIFDGALASPPLNCEGLNVTLTKAGDNCKACHRDFD